MNKLRSCQDKLLNVCAKMLEEIEPGVAQRSREFRAKFPGEKFEVVCSVSQNCVCLQCKQKIFFVALVIDEEV